MQWIYQPQLHKDKGPFIIYQSGGDGWENGGTQSFSHCKERGPRVDYLLLRRGGVLKILKKQSL